MLEAKAVSTGPELARREGEALIWMGELTLLRMTGEQSGGRYSMAEVFVTPAGLVPLHVHHREDEAFYVLDGDLTIHIGDATHEAKAGSFVFGPRDVPHRYVVNSPTARLLMIFSPAGFEGFIRGTSVPAGSLTPPAPGEVEADFDRVLVCADAYGAEVLEG